MEEIKYWQSSGDTMLQNPTLYFEGWEIICCNTAGQLTGIGFKIKASPAGFQL